MKIHREMLLFNSFDEENDEKMTMTEKESKNMTRGDNKKKTLERESTSNMHQTRKLCIGAYFSENLLFSFRSVSFPFNFHFVSFSLIFHKNIFLIVHV